MSLRASAVRDQLRGLNNVAHVVCGWIFPAMSGTPHDLTTGRNTALNNSRPQNWQMNMKAAASVDTWEIPADAHLTCEAALRER
jgi:hypothetical protein